MFPTLLTTLFIFSVFSPLIEAVTVTTKYGKLTGLVSSYRNASGPFKSVSKFLGVPFAAPPIGKLRFKAPQPPSQWKPSVRPAKKHGNICLQNPVFGAYYKPYYQNFSFSEDCLYLDIYTPSVNSSLPVLFYIHGGGYQGDTAIRYPSDILALQGVVVVVIQYRLGAFGFLTTGDSAAPGNFGMLDQVEALKWVKKNIKDFGGNPNNVTIFGQSAGGMSVGLHLISPLSKGFFHQAIAESGSDLSSAAMQPVSYGLRCARELAQKLDCTVNDHHEMVACIRTKKGSDIQKAADAMAANFRFLEHVQWAPVVDKNFLLDTPQNLRKMDDFNKVPLIISFNSHEGSHALGAIATNTLRLNESLNNGTTQAFFKSFLTKFAHARDSRKQNADLIADALEFMYTPWPDNTNKYALRSKLIDLVGDYMFVAPSLETAEVHSQSAPVYVYEFAHRSKVSALPAWMGVVHSENVAYDFGIPMLPETPFKFDATDRNVSLLIIAMYADFAKYAEPRVSGVTWEKFNSSHRAYLRLDANPKMASSFYPRRMAFWNDYYRKLSKVKFDKDVASSATTAVSGTAVNTPVTKETFVQIVLSIILAML